MQKTKRGLGSAGTKLNLTKAMRSRISDALTPPPPPSPAVEEPTGGKAKEASSKGASPPATAEPASARTGAPPEERFDLRAVAEAVWREACKSVKDAPFEVRFYLADNREFALSGAKEDFGTIHTLEPFAEVQESLLQAYHKDVVKVEVFTDDDGLTFSSYDDFVEWLELD